MPESIAIIAPGEMGSGVGRRLHERGARVLTSLAGRSAKSAERAARAGFEIVDDDARLVAEANFILSIVPPGDAIGVAQRFQPALARAARKPVYVDCNAVAPESVRRIEAILSAAQCPFVDVGIIGSPPQGSGPGPRFYASGAAAQALERVAAYGIDVRRMEGPIGAASALKMSYAGLTKGLTALGAVMMLGATRAGADAALLQELASSQPQMLTWLVRQVPRMYPKAYRWAAEMEEIANFLSGDAAGQQVYRGTAHLYERLAGAAGAGSPAEQGELAALSAFCREGARLLAR